MPSASQKAHTAGSRKPAKTVCGVVRLYSSRFCPHSHSTRLVLAAKKIPHEVVNVNTIIPPEWFEELSPAGILPVLQKNGTVIYSAPVCNDWLDDVFQQEQLNHADPTKRAKGKMTLQIANMVIQNIDFILWHKFAEEKVTDLKAGLTLLSNRLTEQYFEGDKAGMTDYNIWPWFERLELLNYVRPEITIFLPDRLRRWTERMKRHPAVKENLLNPKLFVEFVRRNIANDHSCFDVGL